jgi:hypothetical protein
MDLPKSVCFASSTFNVQRSTLLFSVFSSMTFVNVFNATRKVHAPDVKIYVMGTEIEHSPLHLGTGNSRILSGNRRFLCASKRSIYHVVVV